MANPNDHGVDKILQPNRTQYPLDECYNFTGTPGYLYPVYCRECTIGDTVELSPNLKIRFAPTVQPILTRMKAVIDYFMVPLQSVWKNSPFFFNAKQNQVDFMPEMPTLVHQRSEGFFKTGTLADYLGVATTVPDIPTIPFNLDFNISFDSNTTRYRPTLSSPSGQKWYQYCFLGAYESMAESGYNQALNPQFADTNDGDEFMDRLYSVYGMNVNSQRASYDYTVYNGASIGLHRGDINVCPFSINDSYGQHELNGIYLFGTTKRSLMCGAVGQITNLNPNGINHRLSRRFYVDGSFMSSYFPSTATEGLYVVMFARKLIDGRVMPAQNYKIAAYATPSQVTVDVFQRPSSHAATYSITLDDDALGNFNDALDALFPSSQPVPDVMTNGSGRFGYEVALGFFTYYPAGDWDANQGYFSLPYDAPVAEDRYNSQRPAEITLTLDSHGTATYNPDILPPDPNIITQSGGEIGYEYDPFILLPFHQYFNCLGLRVSGLMYVDDVVEADEVTNSKFSYDGDTPPAIPLNALRFRAYEEAFNFWYRNKDLNPLLDSNGNRVINQYLTDEQMADGPDTYPYRLHKSLLEKDQFTSCLPEPLVNYAPLVGVREKDERNVILDFAARDGISSVSIGTETGADGLEYTKITGYGKDIPEETMSVLKDCINQGISIHDIHSVESLTRWISNHVEHGYNTTDQQLASFGVKSDWNPLTAPIYLGGTSELINDGVVVSQSTDSLGEMAGLLTATSSQENIIKHFCKERGYIIGIMRIVPVPCYTSAMPLDMMKFDFTDYYMPEFDRKGWEPVKYKELCPILSAMSPSGSGTSPDDVFGFNVPWHDYKFSFDSAHGDLRKSLSNCVLYREFGEVPVLGNAFTECDPDDYNNIYRQESPLSNKFVAQVYHTALWTRPISNPQTRVF